MLTPVRKLIVQKRLFGLLCFVSLVAALWNFKVMDYRLVNAVFSEKINWTTTTTTAVGATTCTSSASTSTTTTHDNIACDKLIEGQPKEIKRAQNFLRTNFRRSYMPEIYRSLTRDCPSYVSTRGYINYTVSKEEELFPLAFSLVVYKHAEQVERLLRAIWRPHNLYCIHIDKKSPRGFADAITSIAKCFKNVFIHPTSLSVVWGTFSVLEPELNCMDLLWKQAQKWKYFINLTGQEFPLRTNYELYMILKSYNGANDIDGAALGPDYNRWKGSGDPPYKIKPLKGSVHIAASRGFVNYVLHNTTAHDLLTWVKKTAIPDENYFNTLNYNPHLKVPGSYAGNVYDGRHRESWTRYKIWYDGNLCAGKFVRGVCIFSVGDLISLTTSKYMFANKFNFDYDYLAYDCLETWYHGKVVREKQGHLEFNTTVYTERLMVKHHF